MKKTKVRRIIPAALLAKVRLQAKMENVSASFIVNRAIQRDLEQHRVKSVGRATERTAA